MVQVYGAELNILGKHWGFASSCLEVQHFSRRADVWKAWSLVQIS